MGVIAISGTTGTPRIAISSIVTAGTGMVEINIVDITTVGIDVTASIDAVARVVKVGMVLPAVVASKVTAEVATTFLKTRRI